MAGSGWLPSFNFAEPMTACATTGHWIFSGQVTAALRRMSQCRPAVTLAFSMSVDGARSIRAPTERIDCLTVSPPNSSLLSPRYASREERGRSWLLNLANLRVDN